MVEPTLTDSKSKVLFERAKKILPGGVNSPVRAFEPYPFFVESAQGSKMFDADGKAYVDYCMAYGALLLGHANAEIHRSSKSPTRKRHTLRCPNRARSGICRANQQSLALHGNDAPCEHRHRSHHARYPSSKRLHWTEKKS